MALVVDEISSCQGNSAQSGDHIQDGATDALNSNEGCLQGWAPPPHPRPLPEPPSETAALYTLDHKTRVVRCDFSSKVPTLADRRFLVECMEYGDLTLITKGLDRGLNLKMWTWNYVKERLGRFVYHKFKLFRRDPGPITPSTLHREGGWLSMRIQDYDTYLCARKNAVKQKSHVEPLVLPGIPGLRGPLTLNAATDAVYLLDLSLPQLLPELAASLQHESGFAPYLPGGPNCMFRFVPAHGRPFLGPNMYVGPEGAHTWFHCDGRGTVDSLHTCISGENDVIIFKRLSRTNNHAVLRALASESGAKTDAADVTIALLPHDDQEQLATPRLWPSSACLESLARAGAGPTCVRLRPGETIHINKARLHAFRKRGCSTGAGDEDGHGACFSVAWDWANQGVTRNGVFAELKTAVQNSLFNRKAKVKSLGIPITCALRALQAACVSVGNGASTETSLPSGMHEILSRMISRDSKTLTLLRRHPHVVMAMTRGVVVNHVDAWQDTAAVGAGNGVDPHGVEGFQCAECGGELWNMYLHCHGCEGLLSRDHNLCADCFLAMNPTQESSCTDSSSAATAAPIASTTSGRKRRLPAYLRGGAYTITGSAEPARARKAPRDSGGSRGARTSVLKYGAVDVSVVTLCSHWVPSSLRASGTACSCAHPRVAPQCPQCSRCSHCSCNCHARYQVRFRFVDPAGLDSLMSKIRSLVGGDDAPLPLLEEAQRSDGGCRRATMGRGSALCASRGKPNDARTSICLD